MCQLFPVFYNLKQIEKIESVNCYYGATRKHMADLEGVFLLLNDKQYINEMPERPLKYMNYDLNEYGQAIYEINFPEDLLNIDAINRKLNI